MSSTFLTDLEHVGLTGYSIAPGTTISSATTTSGTAVDCLTMEGPISGVFLTGNVGDATLTLQFKLTECDTSGGTYTDVADGAGSVSSASATANDNLVTIITATQRTKRYVKCAIVSAGAGTLSAPVAAFVVGRSKIVGSSTGTYTTIG